MQSVIIIINIIINPMTVPGRWFNANLSGPFIMPRQIFIRVFGKVGLEETIPRQIKPNLMTSSIKGSN